MEVFRRNSDTKWLKFRLQLSFATMTMQVEWSLRLNLDTLTTLFCICTSQSTCGTYCVALSTLDSLEIRQEASGQQPGNKSFATRLFLYIFDIIIFIVVPVYTFIYLFIDNIYQYKNHKSGQILHTGPLKMLNGNTVVRERERETL